LAGKIRDKNYGNFILYTIINFAGLFAGRTCQTRLGSGFSKKEQDKKKCNFDFWHT